MRAMDKTGPLVCLETILDAGGACVPRVEALARALEARDPKLLPLARARLRSETDAFVLATMATVIGALGDESDRTDLIHLLTHEESRVVSSALGAIGMLRILLGREQLENLARSPNPRVSATALVALGDLDLDWVLCFVRDSYPGAGGELRRALLHALGHGKCRESSD